MHQLKNVCGFILFIALANHGFAQGGFRVDVTSAPDSGMSTSASSTWAVRLQQKNVVLRWSCSPFTHSQQTALRTDATLTAQVVSGQGAVVASPPFAQSRTAVSVNQNTANVTMAMHGTGKLDVQLNVAIDAQSAAAGKHDAIVELTVTGL